MAERGALRARWGKAFGEALDADSWGQLEEAQELYQRLVRMVAEGLHDPGLGIEPKERSFLAKLEALLGMRVDELRTGHPLGLGVETMKALEPVFKDVLLDPHLDFPFQLPAGAVRASAAIEPTAAATEVEGGTLLPPPVLEYPGDEALVITVQKMGHKDPSAFIDPFITVSMFDANGTLMESQQDTPISNRSSPFHVHFDTQVHIQSPLRNLRRGTAFVFEFKHFKPKKKKISTRAWAFFELDELDAALGESRNGELALEIYEKPTDPRRRNLKLLSVKRLYLHLGVTARIA